MALQGSLEDFSLAEMFRLLAAGSKSGVLHVTSPETSGTACFRDGRLTYAAIADGNETLLSERLARTGLVKPKQLRQAAGLRKIQRGNKAGRSVGDILVEEGYIGEDELKAFVRDQAAEALFALLQVQTGELEFEGDAASAADDLGVPVSALDVLGLAQRRIEDWRRLRERVPDTEVRYAMSSAPSERVNDIRVSPHEWAVLCCLHGGASVYEVMEMTGFDEFNATDIISRLVNAGLVESMGDAEAAS